MSSDMETMTLGEFDVEIEPSGKPEELDIYNCLLTLYGSKEGEQALDREFGLNMECLSLPAEAAQAMLTAEIIRKTKKYEPRAEVLEVEYETSHSQQGRIRPKVVVQIVYHCRVCRYTGVQRYRKPYVAGCKQSGDGNLYPEL